VSQRYWDLTYDYQKTRGLFHQSWEEEANFICGPCLRTCKPQITSPSGRLPFASTECSSLSQSWLYVIKSLSRRLSLLLYRHLLKSPSFSRWYNRAVSAMHTSTIHHRRLFNCPCYNAYHIHTPFRMVSLSSGNSISPERIPKVLVIVYIITHDSLQHSLLPFCSQTLVVLTVSAVTTWKAPKQLQGSIKKSSPAEDWVSLSPSSNNSWFLHFCLLLFAGGSFFSIVSSQLSLTVLSYHHF
jgi:hypothetical protein